MKRLISIFYERCPMVCKTRPYQAVAYRDYERLETVMVLWPFHWIFLFVHWIAFRWCKHRMGKSWIDRMVDAAVKQSEESDARRWIRKQLYK